MFIGLLANTTVRDSTQANGWYSKLFGRDPDSQPMEGLLEWHIAQGCGLQVWAEPERAGSSTVVIDDSDLDGLARRLTALGVDHAGPEPGGGQRILRIEDPDGNRIVFSGA